VILLVDVSGSMSARDVEPTRLDAAVAAMRTFIDRLPKRFKVAPLMKAGKMMQQFEQKQNARENAKAKKAGAKAKRVSR